MDEAKEKGCAVSVATESSVTVTETVVETMVCEGQVQLEEGGEGGHSHGDDIMVEVLGSHVYVDGICTTDGGGGGGVGGDLNDEAVRGHDESGDVGLEGHPRSLDGEGHTAGVLDSRNEVSGGEASSPIEGVKTQNDVNGPAAGGSDAPDGSAAADAGENAERSSGKDEDQGHANQALERQKDGDLDGNESNRGDQKAGLCSSAVSEESSVQNQVANEAARIDGEYLNARDDAPETISEGTREAAYVDADAKLLDVKTEVAAEDVSVAKDSISSCQSTDLVDQGQLDDKVISNMEIDKLGNDSEQREMQVNAPHKSNENHAAGNDQSSKTDTVIDREEANFSTGEAMEVENQNSGPKSVGFDADQAVKVQEEHIKAETTGVQESVVGQDMTVEEQVTSAEHDGLDQVEEMEVEEHDTDSDQPTNMDEKTGKRTALRSASAVKVHQAKYQLPLEEEGDFSVSALVWGKVRSHPWWPGQIFDPSDASEKAVKYHKKDCFLVAYFGDRTFAWNEASLLKPFRTHFSQIEKHSNSESFQNAVNCALEEVSRRVELGFSCSCIPQDAYEMIKFQKVENTGIRLESSIRGVDMSLSATAFEPDKLVDYVKALAESPSGGGDRLDLVIAKAQLLSFYRLKGYYQLPEFLSCGGLSEKEANTSHSEEKMHFGEVVEHTTPLDTDGGQASSGQETSKTQRSSYLKRKHNLKDGIYPSKKERSLSELMGESFDSPDGENGSYAKKRRAVDSFEDSMGQDGRKTISLAKVSPTTPNLPKPSFKIGECIRRAASQMTGSPSILKSKLDGGSENLAGDGFDVSFDNSEDAQQKRMNITTEYSSLEELLSQLHLTACDPMNSYSSLNIIISFFSDFRDSLVVDQLPGDKAGGKRKKSPNSIIWSPETFEFEDMNDTYWTDRIVQNGSEQQPLNGNGRGQYQIVPVELGKPVQRGRKSRKRYSDVNHDLTAEKPPGYVDEKAPAELVMNFSEINSVPSEIKLNKMFKHFGPLKETETEVDRETSRARVVFRRSSDAEVAYNSAGKFNIFGPVAVNYQLNYTISESFKASLYAPTLAEETPLMASTLGGDHALVTSTLGETSLIAPSLGEEASFMVSTLGGDLPMATTFHEDSSMIASTLGEDALSIPATFSDGTSVIASTFCDGTSVIGTTMYEETLPIATTAGEGTMGVASTIGDQSFMVSNATTLGEQFSTIVTTISEQTSTVVTTLGEEASVVATTLSRETSTITTTLGEETSMVNVSLGVDTSSIAILGQESSTVASTLAEEAPSIPTTLSAETSSIPTTLGEETPSAPTIFGEETPSVLTTFGGETSSIPATFGEETPSISTTLAEGTSTAPDIQTTLGEETPAIPPTTSEETPALPPTTSEETPALPPTTSEETPVLPPTFTKETPTIAATLGQETQAIPTTVNEETTTAPAALGEETTTVTETLGDETKTVTETLGEETKTDIPTLGEDSKTDSAIMGDETTTIPAPMDEDTTTIPAPMDEDTTTIPALMDEDTATIPTTLHEETQAAPATLAGETPIIPTTMGEETSTLGEETPTNPSTLGEETSTTPAPVGEEIPTTPTTLGKEAPTITTNLGEEAATVLTSSGQEALTAVTSTVEEASPVVTTTGEETVVTSTVEEASTVITTTGEEASSVVISTVEEASIVITTTGEEASTVVTSTVEEASTVITTTVEEASTVPTATGEEISTVSTASEMETMPPAMAEGEESAA